VHNFYHRLWYYCSVGLINLLVFTLFYAVNSRPPVLASAQSINQSGVAPQAFQLKQGTPNRLIIPSLNLAVPVETGAYRPANDSWTLDEQHAFYAEASTPANNKRGSTLIYGHRLPAIFEKLPSLQQNDTAIVYTDNGYKFYYSYVYREEVDPTDTSIFSSYGKPILTLQTCSGSWDQLRALYSFKLQSVEKP